MTIAVSTEGVAEVKASPNPDVMEAWATALESGKYPQTTGTLKRVEPSLYGQEPVGDCCLGVLCELAVEAGVISVGHVNNGKVGFDTGHYNMEYSELPPAVVSWAGLSAPNPYVTYRRTDEEIQDDFLYEGDYVHIEDVPTTDSDTFADLNDSKGRDFKEIAQIIRDNYLS